MTDKPVADHSKAGTSNLVLAVDDAPENLRLLEVVLRAGGYTFAQASGGAECLALLARLQPRLILLDVEMPGMDGFETCKILRATRSPPQIPVAFLTARKTADDVKKCLEVGGNDFIFKPFDTIKLLERVKYWTAFAENEFAAEQQRLQREISNTRLKSAQETLSDAVDSISEAFVIYDSTDRFVLCNAEYRRIFVDHSDLCNSGESFEHLIKDSAARGLYLAAVGREDEWVGERLEAHRNPCGAIEHQLADGRHLLVTERRMRNGGTAGLLIDITTLKETEAQLREAMDNLDRAQRLSHTGSDVRDRMTDHAEWSEETYRIFGVDPDTFVPSSENFLSLVIPEDRPKVLASREAVARGQNPTPFEYRIRRPSGEVRWIRRITEVIRDDDGVPVRVAGALHDVTELREGEKRQKELEHRLLQSQKLEAVGVLAGGIAHEFNNALVPILGLCRLILEDLPASSDVREDIEIILESTQRAQGLVRGILAFSRNEEASKTEIDPVQLVRRSLSVLRATLPATLQIEEELAPVPPVLGDAGALQQVLVNLVTNAAHAIGNAIGTITVGVEAAPPEQIPSHHTGKEFIRLRIADTGCGMDAITVQRIFEPFFTTKSVGEGTGLGLSVVHGIVTDHDGQIDVHSEPGKGTEFNIYLPAAAAIAPLPEAVA